MTNFCRVEKDCIGEKKLPTDCLYGIHTLRACENFPITDISIHPEFIKAYGLVKLACAQTNHSLGIWTKTPEKYESIIRACREMAEGLLDEYIVVDPLQGGAGTSTNMNLNEVIANRALEIIGESHGVYHKISPLGDINLHQSTNDTYPTALKLAEISLLHKLEGNLVALVEIFQNLEKKFSHVVKIGRTQFQDAVLTTLGRSMGAYAEALTRDRWRIYKCEERLRTVNLGGTAIGTGLGAPRQYIFRVVDKLRELTGIGFARAENLLECTQNNDIFVEVSGILKACSTTLFKICTDLRLLSSGPHAGFAEISLPKRQAGSSIMPGKVNPVIPESVCQVALLVMGYDNVIAMACASGSLELNPFLPLVAHCLLRGTDMLAQACDILRRFCVEGIEANEENCQENVENSTAIVTALLPYLSYEKLTEIASIAQESEKTIKQIILEKKWMTQEQFEEAITPEAVCRLGSPKVM